MARRDEQIDALIDALIVTHGGGASAGAMRFSAGGGGGGGWMSHDDSYCTHDPCRCLTHDDLMAEVEKAKAVAEATGYQGALPAPPRQPDKYEMAEDSREFSHTMQALGRVASLDATGRDAPAPPVRPPQGRTQP